MHHRKRGDPALCVYYIVNPLFKRWLFIKAMLSKDHFYITNFQNQKQNDFILYYELGQIIKFISSGKVKLWNSIYLCALVYQTYPNYRHTSTQHSMSMYQLNELFWSIYPVNPPSYAYVGELKASRSQSVIIAYLCEVEPWRSVIMAQLPINVVRTIDTAVSDIKRKGGGARFLISHIKPIF